MKIQISQKLTNIIKDIDKQNGSVFFVGGCVRDTLLNRKNKDVDLEIHNITIDKVTNILKQYGQVDVVGKQFGVLKIKGFNVDFAFPRKDSKKGSKHTSFDVLVNPFLSLTESARRRDFTMNAIMENAITGELVDPFNGINDLKNHVIKMVDKKTFSDDPLRVLRAAQFSARFNFKIDNEIIKVGKTLNYKYLSVERIEEELYKGFMSNHPSKMLIALKEMNVFKQLSPNIEKMESIKQNPKWHPEGNVWIHSLQVTDMGVNVRSKSSDPFAFMVTCLVHDIGKIKTTKMNNNKITAYKHEVIGSEMISETLKNLIKSKHIIRYVKQLTRNHMLGHKILNMRDITLRRLMLNENIKDILLFNICDSSKGGRTFNEAKEAAEFNSKLQRAHSLEQGATLRIIPVISGKDLINLGLTPSPKFKELLNKSIEWQMEDRNRDSILKTLKKICTNN